MKTAMSKNKLEKLLNSLVIKRIRTCQSTHACCLCPNEIKAGDRYFDGGLDRRAHTQCVKEARGTQG